jgi:hypothetical protein
MSSWPPSRKGVLNNAGRGRSGKTLAHSVPYTRPNQGLELTAYSLRYAPASGSSSGLAFGAFTLREHEKRRCQCESEEFSQPHVLCTMQMQPVVAGRPRNNRGT